MSCLNQVLNQMLDNAVFHVTHPYIVMYNIVWWTCSYQARVKILKGCSLFKENCHKGF